VKLFHPEGVNIFMKIKLGDLLFTSVVNHPYLVAKSVQETIGYWKGSTASEEFLVSEIDPEFSDSLAFCENYNIPLNQGANCLIIEAKRGNNIQYAACLVPINTRANLNNVVRKYLDVRQVSLAPKDFAVFASGMEFGSITIIGLPKDWKLLIDESLIHVPHLVIGGGLRKSKLLIPGKVLSELPNAIILKGLTTPLS